MNDTGGSSAAHWGTKDPAGQPSRDEVLGLPRMVLEARSRLGEAATPDQVADDLLGRGIEVTVDDVRKLWSEASAYRT